MEKDNTKKEKLTSDIANALTNPDPETLNKTDPQDDMKGLISSLIRKGGKVMETKKNKEEANKKHDENM